MVSPKRFLAGSIYLVADERLRLAGSERTVHNARRPVLVVSDQNAANGTNALPASDWPSLLVIPISSSTSHKTRFDVRLAAGEGNLTKKSWARVPGLQMIDKDYLDDLTGQVSPQVLDDVTAQILSYLGIIEPEPAADEEEPF